MADTTVDSSMLDRMAVLVDKHPRTLLVIGYSEADETVVSDLIGPLTDRWWIARIGPSVSGELAIRAGAEQVLPRLAGLLCVAEETSPWEHVTFHDQRDGLGAALRGARLGPGDVTACPRLPEVADVGAALAATSTAVLRGASGGGKSITAYQALADHAASGFEVLRLREGAANRTAHEILDSLAALPRPSVALVDDAQAVDPDLLRRLLEAATPQRHMLVVSTDPVPGPAVIIEIAEQRAVGVLAQAVLRQRTEILAQLQTLDDHIGEGVLDDPLEWRVETTAEEKLPWQFAFVLTHGWRRARATLARLRDHDRADLPCW